MGLSYQSARCEDKNNAARLMSACADAISDYYSCIARAEKTLGVHCNPDGSVEAPSGLGDGGMFPPCPPTAAGAAAIGKPDNPNAQKYFHGGLSCYRIKGGSGTGNQCCYGTTGAISGNPTIMGTADLSFHPLHPLDHGLYDVGPYFMGG